MVTEKICSTCNKSLPAMLAYFEPANRAADGLTNDCKKCRAKDRGDATSVNHKTKIPKASPLRLPKPPTKKKLKPGAERKILAINIESEPELWPALAERASAEMRTPVAQALWILKEELI